MLKLNVSSIFQFKISKEPKLSFFLNFLNDSKKQFLTNDKFVQSLNEEGIFKKIKKYIIS